ncbi:DNA-binding transcriptional regulator CytR [Erwinia tracheiphila]|uniref:Transcriptional regulator n=2 Tax=Erwinia tracheiphila TaxID=65700 RepID=A0A0M2KIW9_9GAMM|nr:DNA-binding transcriptional regulator CytR [Erwinia tracheiphila]AXF78519.1 DNA-binding transcriptional regulator CytR [Erwinia tracheiphila]EOS94664.1 DNA-binding transcriptional regulator CytR [Erwinia tracheiphila PSU-1]KKF36936.1 transcriptional regulator [Erwinia tracheiphila]UIA82754.1 DNA-binding transcriptional regulator CytR [Erwinia tracheiphila]UIA88282.1 DNA-binding transcriptional regulator CytR [Erwinia tracheiphila]
MEQNQEASGATMRDVAKKAGVSTATVSRTLMNPDKVSAATRQKVEEAVIAVGYSPNGITRNARRTESRTILVIVPNICDPFFSEIIRGIEVVAADRGYLVLIGDCAHQTCHEQSFLNLIMTRQVDGMIMLGSQLPFESTPEERQNLPPMVMANEFAPELELPSVHIDNLTAAFEAVNHLLKLGHSRIACIAGPHDMPLCQYRLQGYIQALQRHGIVAEPRYIARVDFTFDAGATAMKQLMALPAPPDALFCHSDILALGAMAQAKNMGLRIPQDLSLIGFDDIELSRYSDPPLTTVIQPRFNIGREAMSLLLEQLQGKMVSNGSRLLDFELKIRGSTAPVLRPRR